MMSDVKKKHPTVIPAMAPEDSSERYEEEVARSSVGAAEGTAVGLEGTRVGCTVGRSVGWELDIAVGAHT